MLTIVIVMFSGITCGYLFRRKNLDWTGRCITLAIWGLLFLLGISVGSNRGILDNLDTIGLQAFVLSAGGVLGSAAAAALVYRFFFVSRSKEDDR